MHSLIKTNNLRIYAGCRKCSHAEPHDAQVNINYHANYNVRDLFLFTVTSLK